MTTLAEKLAKRLDGTSLSKEGKPLFFEENRDAHLFANLFSIPEEDCPSFYEAFKIVTQGQGEELRKINSLISSSLLSLLAFYPLFNNTDKNKNIIINGNLYYKCFFEVKNRVVRRPSCIDVVLVSVDEKKMLFLESKLSEYADGLEYSHSYGKGYKTLYEDYGLFMHAFDGYLKLGDCKDSLVLESPVDKKKIYIEGVKQSISHLIGLVQGPQYWRQGYYPKNYYKEYKNFYDRAEVIEYATILFDPKEFEVNIQEFKAYSNLYNNTIIAHGDKILECIARWSNDAYPKYKKIEVLKKILTYQELFSNKHNRPLLIKAVSDFYKL